MGRMPAVDQATATDITPEQHSIIYEAVRETLAGLATNEALQALAPDTFFMAVLSTIAYAAQSTGADPRRMLLSVAASVRP